MPKAEKTADWLFTAIACLWLAVFPLWQGGTFASITRSKFEGMLILTGASLLMALGAAVYALLRREKLPFRFGWRQALALGLFAWMGLSALCSPFRDALNNSGQRAVWMGSVRYEGMATQCCYLLIFLVMSLHPVRLKAVAHAAAAALLIFAGVTAAQYLGANPLGLFPAGRSIRTNYEFQGTIGNIDMVSGYLALTVPLLATAFLRREKGGWLWYAASLAGALLWCCMEVQSGLIALLVLAGLTAAAMVHKSALRPRGMTLLAGFVLCAALRGMLRLPWLDGGKHLAFTAPTLLTGGMLLLGAALLGAAALLRRKPGRDVSLRGTALLAAAVIAAALAAFLLLPLKESHGGLWEIQQTLLGRGEDAFGSYRMAVWRHTLAISAEHPWLGTGPDTFYFALRERLAALGERLPESFDNPHNEYLALLSNCGLPALAGYMALRRAGLG